MTTTPSPNPSDPQRPQTWANPADVPPPFPQTPPSLGVPPTYGTPTGQTPPPFEAYQAPWTAAYQGQAPKTYATADERLWSMMAHLSAVIAWVVSAGWLNIAGPFIVWLLQKDRSPFVRNAAAGAFNFTLTMWLVGVLGWVFTITIVGAIIGIPMIIISGIGSIVLGIIGALKAWNGEAYTYPWQLKVLS